jgi:phosphohistidine phosphatase
MLGDDTNYLILMRHAKTIPHSSDINDWDRYLTEHGIYQAKNSANFLLNNSNIIPQLIICSPAKRAIQTAEIVADTLNLPNNIIILQKSLYNNDLNSYLDTIYQVDDDIRKLMIVGHNPSISMLAALLTNSEVNSMKTATILGLEIISKRWLNFDLKPKNTWFFFSPD